MEGDLLGGLDHVQQDGHLALCGEVLHVDLQAEVVVDRQDFSREPEVIGMDDIFGTGGQEGGKEVKLEVEEERDMELGVKHHWGPSHLLPRPLSQFSEQLTMGKFANNDIKDIFDLYSIFGYLA